MATFNTFPSNRQSSHMETPRTTPLRKRENDSFASPEAPLLWRQPLQAANGALHPAYSPSIGASSSHYADLNFVHSSRRRGRYGSRSGAQFWVPWMMKAILASPLIVVLFWIVAVAFHHPTQSSVVNNNSYGATGKRARNLFQHKQQQQKSLLAAAAQHHGPNNNAHQDKKRIPIYVPMGEGFSPPDAQQLMMPQSGWQMPFMLPQSQNGYMPNQMQMMQPQQQMLTPGQNMMQLTTQQQPIYQQAQPMYQQAQPMYQQAQPQMMQMQQQMMQAQPQYMNQMQLQQQQPQNQLGSEPAENLPVLMAPQGSGNQKQRSTSHLRGAQESANRLKNEQPYKIYYYDPSDAMVQGKLQAPSLVYDEHGNEVELAALTSSDSQIIIEAPQAELMDTPAYGSAQIKGGARRLIISNNSTNSTLPLPILPPPPLQMKFKTPEAWGESTTQDQSIIIVTVATMALLVGALSARRLRSRSFLSSCIENESLEDEVAYDNAYTIAGGDSYNTFGWKGDLEKFDV